MQNDDGGLQSAAPGTKTAIHRQKNVGMSKSATLATRNETTRYLERRTHHRHGRTAFTRAPVDGCGRLRAVAQRLANTAATPKFQNETGTLVTHSGKLVNILVVFLRYTQVRLTFSMEICCVC